MALLHIIITLLVALVDLGTAIMQPSEMPLPTPTLVTRINTTHTSFYACEKANWGGKCEWFQMSVGECLTLPSLWNDTISSFGPDPGYTCTVHADANCSGNGTGNAFVKSFQYPGVADLGKEKSHWNSKISSVKCSLTGSQKSSATESDTWIVTSTTTSTVWASCTTVTVNPRATWILDKRSDIDIDKGFCDQ